MYRTIVYLDIPNRKIKKMQLDQEYINFMMRENYANKYGLGLGWDEFVKSELRDRGVDVNMAFGSKWYGTMCICRRPFIYGSYDYKNIIEWVLFEDYMPLESHNIIAWRYFNYSYKEPNMTGWEHRQANELLEYFGLSIRRELKEIQVNVIRHHAKKMKRDQFTIDGMIRYFKKQIKEVENESN